MTEVSLRDYMEAKLGAFETRLDAYHTHFTTLIEAHEKAFIAALASQALAVEKAEANATLWRAQANEWRGAMIDRERNFASSVEVEDLKKSRDLIAGRTVGASALWGYIVGAVGLLATVLALTGNI